VGGKKKLTIEGQGRKIKNFETQNPNLGLGFIPSKNSPKGDFLDGALVGAGSLKPPKLTS
jgi:hypothetical protein